MNLIFLSIGIVNLVLFGFEFVKGLINNNFVLSGFSFVHLSIAILAIVLGLMK